MLIYNTRKDEGTRERFHFILIQFRVWGLGLFHFVLSRSYMNNKFNKTTKQNKIAVFIIEKCF